MAMLLLLVLRLTDAFVSRCGSSCSDVCVGGMLRVVVVVVLLMVVVIGVGGS